MTSPYPVEEAEVIYKESGLTVRRQDRHQFGSRSWLFYERSSSLPNPLQHDRFADEETLKVAALAIHYLLDRQRREAQSWHLSEFRERWLYERLFTSWLSFLLVQARQVLASVQSKRVLRLEKQTPVTGEPTNASHSQSSENLQLVLSRVLELGKPDVDSDITPATPFALRTTLELLLSASRQLIGEFPRGAPTTDDDGSISIYWMKPERSIELTMPADEHGTRYLYHREGQESRLEQDVVAGDLAQRLMWFAGA